MNYAITLSAMGAGYLASNFTARSKITDKALTGLSYYSTKIVNKTTVPVIFAVLGLAMGASAGLILNRLAFSAFTAKSINIAAGAAAGAFASIRYYHINVK